MDMLFNADGLQVRLLQRQQLAPVQALFEANAAYFVAVGGQAPAPGAAVEEFDERPPAHLSFSEHGFCGVHDTREHLIGVVIYLRDFCAAGVWHIALFLIDSSLHGSGTAQRLHQALATFALANGARWLRLAVIQGNARAERFWARNGYVEVRTREFLTATSARKISRVMVKPLAGAGLDEYRDLVPRDRPGSALP